MTIVQSRKFLIFSVLAIVTVLYAYKTVPKQLELEVEIIAAPPGDFSAIYLSEGDRIDESSRLEKFPIIGKRQIYRVEIHPEISYKLVRWDPLWAQGKLQIKRASYSRFGRSEIELDQVVVMHGEVSLESNDKGLVVTSRELDPYIKITSNLSAYSPDSAIGLFLLCVAAFVVALLGAMVVDYLLTLLYSARERSRLIRTFIQSIEKTAAHLIVRWRSKIHINYWVVIVAALLVGAGSYLHLEQIGGQFSGFDFLTVASFLLRALFVSLLVTIIFAVFIPFDIATRYMVAVIVSTLGIYFYLNALIFTLNGMTLSHGASMLFNGGLKNFPQNLEFTGLSGEVIRQYSLGLIVLVVLYVLLVKVSVVLKIRYPLLLSVRRTATIIVACGAMVVMEQALSYSVKSSRLLAAEQKSILGYTPLFPADPYLFRYKIMQRPVVRKDQKAALVRPSPGVKSLPVFIFIIESLREDFINKTLTPALMDFKEDARVYQRAIASGNASHYGWFSIVNSRYPMFWETLIKNEHVLGSPPLQVLQKNGYVVNVFSTKDLSYLSGFKYMAGSDQQQFDMLLEIPELDVPTSDYYVIDKLGEYIGGIEDTEKSINLIFMDSLHFPYRWAGKLSGMEDDFVGDPVAGISLHVARNLAISDPGKIINRYKNSVRFTDDTFGRFIEYLKQHYLYEKSIIAVVSDHGQQFMEHGYLMHGATLYPEDIYIPLYIKLPGENGVQKTGMTSQLDIMPTILDYLGMYDGNQALFDGSSLLRRAKSYAFTSVAGLQNTPYRFAIETLDFKLDFELQEDDPHRSRWLYIKNIRRTDDTDFVPGSGSREDYVGFVESHFKPFLKDLSFIDMLELE